MSKWGLKETVESAVLAVVYAALTVAVAPFAYGPIQFRISEVLMPLPNSRKFSAAAVVAGLTIGTFLANIISPYGIWDMTIGTFSTFLATLLVYFTRYIGNRVLSRAIACAIVVVVITVLIGYVLLHAIYQVPLLESMTGVFIGEFVTAGIGGFTLLTILDRGE